jgi:von Willebrand factor type A domain
MFDNIVFLWGLLLLVPLLLIFLNVTRSFQNFEKSRLKNFMAYSRVPSKTRRYLSYCLYITAIAAAVIGLAEPYIMLDVKEKKYQDVRLIFLVDVSRSMVYAEDVPPNRLEATKREIRNFYKSLDGVYDCSILPFAGSANPYFCPMTSSRASFNQMLDEMTWESAPTLGTDLTRAMQSIDDIYVKKDGLDKNGLNIVILLSDGGKEEALGTDRIALMKLSRELAGKNFKFYTVGVGGDKACPLVLRNSQGAFINYVFDDKGQVAYSQMDEEILQQLAEIGHGKYYRLNASAELFYDLNEIIKENRKDSLEINKREKIYLQPYLFSITVCLLFSCLLLNKV